MALVFLILSVITILLLIIKLSGHSPDSITILSLTVTLLIALQILVLTILFQVKGDMSEILTNVRISEHKKITRFSVPENQRFSWHPKNSKSF